MNIQPEILDLIHAELDGVASESEKVALRAAIARDPAVADEYRRLKGLCELLAKVAPEVPQSDLVPKVMRRVRMRSATGTSLLDRVRGLWPEGHTALRYGYAVAAGAVIGVVGLQLATGGRFFGPAVPEREASATLMPERAVRRLDLSSAGVGGFATLAPSTSGAAIGLDVRTDEPVEFLLRFDPVTDGGKLEVSVVRTGQAVPAGSLRLPKRD
jgi:anti-sigma factor RsiW